MHEETSRRAMTWILVVCKFVTRIVYIWRMGRGFVDSWIHSQSYGDSRECLDTSSPEQQHSWVHGQVSVYSSVCSAYIPTEICRCESCVWICRVRPCIRVFVYSCLRVFMTGSLVDYTVSQPATPTRATGSQHRLFVSYDQHLPRQLIGSRRAQIAGTKFTAS